MTYFHEQIDVLKSKVLQMAVLAERAVDRALTAFMNRDADTAQDIIERDQEINAIEVEIDNLSLKLLALDQPMAKDLRFIVGCMRMIVDLERIGDEATNIAERILFLSNLTTQPVSPLMEKLSAKVREMFFMAMQAFKEGDVALAAEVCRMDQEADELYFKVVKNALDVTVTDVSIMERAIHRIMAAKAMERIADQSTNIAEAAIFVVKGVSVKHQCLP